MKLANYIPNQWCVTGVVTQLLWIANNEDLQV